jgi:YebC/PmpR family DNA-binding regulatory protein
MSGHSKWATIKHKKAANDAKRGQEYTKHIKLVSSAVKSGGGPDPASNFKLRLAIDKARADNMPMSTIESAIKRAAGEEKDASLLQEVTYEGYGPSGVAVMVQAITDNRNRTAAEIRHLFSKYGGNLGTTGNVGWMFDERGVIELELAGDKEQLTLKVMEYPIEDVRDLGETVEVVCLVTKFETVKKGLEEQGMHILRADVTYVANTIVHINSSDDAQRVMKLLEVLEDNEDVQNVYANCDIDDTLIT